MIFSFGGSGGKKKTTTDTQEKGTQTEEQSGAELESATRTGLSGERLAEDVFGLERTQLLDEETLNILRSLLGGAAGGFQAGGESVAELSDFASFLRERAAGTQEFYDERTGAALEAAQVRGESRQQRRATNLAQSAGSTLNTLVQRGIARDEIQLDTELAALEAGLATQGREAETAALAQAANVSAILPGLYRQPLLDIVGQLRGADITQQQIGGVRRERTELTLEDIINALTREGGVRTDFTQEAKGRSKTKGGEVGFGFET